MQQSVAGVPGRFMARALGKGSKDVLDLRAGGRDLAILVQGDKRLFNQYGVMLENPAKHPNVKKELGQQFIDWLVSPEKQKLIAGYKINGQQLFYPNANDPNA